jgi:hypothetical protein
MSIAEPTDVCEIVDVQDDISFKAFCNTFGTGLAIVPEPFGDENEPTLSSDSGDFEKWIKRSNFELPVHNEGAGHLRVLRSGEYWLPLVFLASNVALPIYLGLVQDYIKDKIRGTLSGDKTRVRLSAVFKDENQGLVKMFKYEGDSKTLHSQLKKFDLNKFLDD